MSENQKQNNLGEQFKVVIQDALDTGDFKNFNDLVSVTVSTAISEAGKQVNKTVNQGNNNMSSNPSPNGMSGGSGGAGGINFFAGNGAAPSWKKDTFHYNYQNNENNYANYSGYARKQKNYPVKSNPNSLLPAVQTNKVGQVSSILYLTFGGIGTGMAVVGLLLGFLCMIFGWTWSGLVFGGIFAALAGFGFMIHRGCVKNNRLKRMQRYIAMCAGKMYINIEDLARQADKSVKYILKDVKKMLRLGFFPEGHLDEQEKCLMLDDATYRQYLKLERERKVKELEEKTRKMQENQRIGAAGWENTSTKAETEQETKPNNELDAMVQEGRDYIRKLRDMNDRIEGEVISAKLYQLEGLLKEIFERVAEHPEQMPQMNKLMNYYLPTTLKLVQAYEEFDGISSPGEDILSAKAEIEKTLDTINQAFAELLNKLFQETVFDITTDAQVLQTMLAKEGLTREMEKMEV